MSSFGVLTTGFSRKDVDDILAEYSTDQKARFGADTNTQADSVLGQLNGSNADRVADLWSLGESIYNNLYPDTASGDALDRLASLNGITRAAATQSSVAVNLNIDAGVTVPVASVASKFGGDGDRFFLGASATNAAGYRDIISATMFSEEFGAITAVATSIDNIETPIAGWSAAAIIKSGSAETYALVDGQTLTMTTDQGVEQTATFNTGDFGAIGAATAAEVAAVITSDIGGATAHAGGGFIYIQSDTDGTGSAINVTGGTANGALGFATTEVKGFNPTDANIGNELETDSSFRLRRENTLRSVGAASVDAIRAQLLTVFGVTDAIVIENTSLATVGGIPGKAFESVVVGGADQDVIDQIGISKPAGIQAFGVDVTGSYVDTQGVSSTIEFSRQDDIDLYVEVDIEVDLGSFGGGDREAGRDEVKLAVKAKGDELLRLGEDFANVLYRCDLIDNTVGIDDVPELRVGTTASPTNTGNETIEPRERGILDTDVAPVSGAARILVKITNDETVAT